MSECAANSLSLNAHSYVAGEHIVYRLTPSPDVPKDRVTNLTSKFFRIENVRDKLAFGFGTAPRVVSGALQMEHDLPADLQPGLYTIAEADLSIWSADAVAQPAAPQRRQIHVVFSPVILQVRALGEQAASPEMLAQQAKTILDRRGELERKPFLVEPLTNPTGHPHFLVIVFGVGCHIEHPQQLEGFLIRPIHEGLSRRNMHEIVARFLEENALPSPSFNEAAEQVFAQSTPVFTVVYDTVVATSPDAALEFCNRHSERIFSILGLDRGQKPRAFAYVAIERDTQQWWYRFDFPRYRGHRNFNPAEPGDKIEWLLPRLEANAFFRLLVSTYSDATSENDNGFALLRFWSVLELIADRRIPLGRAVLHPDGTAILNARGNPETTGSKHGRVYSYILANGSFEELGIYTEAGVEKSYHVGDIRNPNAATATEVFTLWDMVRAVYAIRNSIAHEGTFDRVKAQTGDQYEQLAARLFNHRYLPNPLRFIKMQAQSAILREP